MKVLLRRISPWLLPACLVLLWELASRSTPVLGKYFPPPTAILGGLRLLLDHGELVFHLEATLARLAVAFVLAAVPGVVLGLLMGVSSFWRSLLEPYVLLLFPMPKIALLPLVMILLGVNEKAFVATASVTAFFQIIVSTLGGALSIDPVLLEAAHNYGARGRRLFWKVILPATLPHILTGLRLGLGLALVLTIVVEFTAAKTGLGRLVWQYWQTLQPPVMSAAFAVIGALGLLLTRGLEVVGDRLTPWYEDLSRVGPR